MQQIILNGIPPEDFWAQVRGIVQDVVSTLPRPQTVKPYLSIDEASEFTDQSKSTLYRLTSEKRIPHIKRGGKILFKREELMQWLDEARQPVTA